MTRARDVIDVDLDRIVTIDVATAWSDLCELVFARAGVDLGKSDSFSVRTKVVSETGNRRMSVFLAAPKDVASPDDLMKRGFISFFGECTPWMEQQFIDGARDGARPIFALPLETAMRTN